MGTLFDQVTIHRMEFSNLTTDVTLNCSVQSIGENYGLDVIMTTSGVNELMNALYRLEYDLNFEEGIHSYLAPDGEELRVKEFNQGESPVLPMYLLPKDRLLMRA